MSPSAPLAELRELAGAAFGTKAPRFHLCFGATMLADEADHLQSLRGLGLHDGAIITFLRRQICGPCGYWLREDGEEDQSLKGCRFCNYGWTKTEEETERFYRRCRRLPDALPVGLT